MSAPPLLPIPKWTAIGRVPGAAVARWLRFRQRGRQVAVGSNDQRRCSEQKSAPGGSSSAPGAHSASTATRSAR